jgi:hypothetical protein
MAPTTPQSGGGGRMPAIKPEDELSYFGIPKPVEGLQYTDKLMQQSAAIHDRRQNLINYAKTMWKNYGIDVTNPDPSRKDAVIAKEVFNQEIANLLTDIDIAKQGREDYQKALAGQMAGTYQLNPISNEQYASTLSADQLGTSLAMDPTVAQATQQFGRGFRTPGQVQGAQAGVNQLGQVMGQQPVSPQRQQILQQQVANINPHLEPFAPKEDKGGKGGGGAANFVERFVNHKYGGGNWKVSDTYTKGGENWLESNDYSGTKLGKRTVARTDSKTGKEFEGDLEAVIKKTVRNPDTGEVWVLFTNDQIPPERIDNVASNQVLETMSANNAKFPTLEKIQNYLSENELLTDGVISDDMIVSELTRKAASKMGEEAKKVTRNTEGVIKEIIDSGTVPWIGGKTFQTPLGELTIRKNMRGDKFSVDYPDGQEDEVSKDKLITILRAYRVDSPQQGSSSTFDPDI